MVTSNSSTREQATVKWFHVAKGIGFLIDGDGQDVFVHYRSIEPATDGFKTLIAGELVEFLPVRTSKGRSAAEVKRLSVGVPDLVTCVG